MGWEEIVGLLIGIKENQTRNNVRPVADSGLQVNTSGVCLDVCLAVLGLDKLRKNFEINLTLPKSAVSLVLHVYLPSPASLFLHQFPHQEKIVCHRSLCCTARPRIVKSGALGAALHPRAGS